MLQNIYYVNIIFNKVILFQIGRESKINTVTIKFMEDGTKVYILVQ